MKYLHTYKINEELVKNKSLLKSYVISMLKEIKSKGIPITKNNLKYNEESISSDLELRIDDTYQNKSEKIIKIWQKKLTRYDIIVSYKLYKERGFDIGDELDLIPNNTFTYLFKIYFKNLHTKRIKPNRYVYHYSDPKNRDEILKNGLIPRPHKESQEWNNDIRLTYPDAIFAVNNESDVWRDIDKWQIDTSKISNKWQEDLNFTNRPEFIMTFESIPVDFIKLME